MQFGTDDLSASAIFLDVDGTLLDIAPTPAEVEVPAGLIEVLAALAEATGGALAFVSGRPISDLDRLFKPLQLASVGGHGAEIRLPESCSKERVAQPIDRGLRQSLVAIAARYDGVLIEDKGYSLALHYRLVPERGAAVLAEVEAASAAHPEIELLSGKYVIEIKSPHVSKGTGIRRLMLYAPFRGRRPVFIGDDVTDEAAFAVLGEFDGCGFSVGREIAGLAGSFDSPEEVRQWLVRITDNKRLERP